MNREDIIRMARECFADPDGSLVLLTPELIKFATLVAAAEREACVRLAEETKAPFTADLIRARGQA